MRQVTHPLLRWCLVPLALALTLAFGGALLAPSPPVHAAPVCQTVFITFYGAKPICLPASGNSATLDNVHTVGDAYGSDDHRITVTVAPPGSGVYVLTQSGTSVVFSAPTTVTITYS